MKFPIKFFYPQHLVLLVIMGLCFGFRKVIEILYFKESMPLFLMFLGESLSIIVYLYQKCILLKENEDEIYERKNDIKLKIKIYFMILICSLCDLIGCYDFKIIGSNETNLKNNCNMIFLCVFIALNEHIYLKIQTYNYHILGYILYIFLSIINLLINRIEFNNHLFFILLISLESQYIESLYLIIEKRLIDNYFIKFTYICFLEGIFGMIILYIIDLTSITSDNLLPHNINIFILILYCFFTCLLNLCRLRVAEISRASYIMVGRSLGMLAINIVSSIFDNEKLKYKWNINNILIIAFSLTAAFIYCEVITLHFLNLDKNLTNNIIDRGNRETISLGNYSLLNK